MASEEKEKKATKKARVEVEPTEAELVEEWRRQELRKILGKHVPDDDITTLVKSSEVDLGKARKLSNKGCPPELIVKILAPLAA